MGREARVRKYRFRFAKDYQFAKLELFEGSAGELRADPNTISFPLPAGTKIRKPEVEGKDFTITRVEDDSTEEQP